MDTDTCPISFISLNWFNTITTPCGHKFDRDTLIRALSYNNTCPYCRAVIVIPENERTSPEPVRLIPRIHPAVLRHYNLEHAPRIHPAILRHYNLEHIRRG